MLLNQLADRHINSLLINSRIIMADSKTCKRKRKPNWMQEQQLLLAQLVNENKDIFKGKSGVGITSKNIRLRLFFLSHTRLYREYITSSEMYSLHLTHLKWTHTRSSGQPCYGTRGAVEGSVSCSRAPQSWYWMRRERWLFTPPTNKPCRTWDSNPQPLDYESNSLTIRPRLPLCMGKRAFTFRGGLPETATLG